MDSTSIEHPLCFGLYPEPFVSFGQIFLSLLVQSVFLSSLVPGTLFAVTIVRRGGECLEMIKGGLASSPSATSCGLLVQLLNLSVPQIPQFYCVSVRILLAASKSKHQLQQPGSFFSHITGRYQPSVIRGAVMSFHVSALPCP